MGPMVRLRDLRMAHTLTMRQLAERIGEQGVAITPAGISNVENGHKRASERLLSAWARALGVSPLDVWQGPLRADAYDNSRARASADRDTTQDIP